MPKDNFSSEASEKSRTSRQQLERNISDSNEISDSEAKAIVGGGGGTTYGSVIW